MTRARSGHDAPIPLRTLLEWLSGILCILAIAWLLREGLVTNVAVRAGERLRHGSEDERVEACQALGQVRAEEARSAIPDLAIAAKDASPLVRREAIDALMRVGLRSEVVLSTLVDALKDPEAAIRTGAVRALGMLGTDAGPAATALIRALADPCPEVRAMAAVALAMVDPRGKQTVAALVKALEDDDERVRKAVGSALSRIGFGDPMPTTKVLSLHPEILESPA